MINIIVNEAEKRLSEHRKEFNPPVVEGKFTHSYFICMSDQFYEHMCDIWVIPEEFRDVVIERSKKCVSFFYNK